MASVNKNLLLQKSTPSRIIFVGGSNLSFGLNSQTIKDSLKLNPINTGIHASIGIKYMLDNTLQYIQNGDVVVLVPEYAHYYRSLNFGSEELARTVFDVDITNLKQLNSDQIINILPFLPKYALTKFKLSEYINVKESDVYSVNSFNKYGDTYTHWTLGNRLEEIILDKTSGEFNYEIIKYFENFNSQVNKKGALLLISFPSYQASSYDNSANSILKIEQELKKSNLKIIGTPERYKMADSLMFNTAYHLSKQGVDYRTKMIIEDIKKYERTTSVLPNGA